LNSISIPLVKINNDMDNLKQVFFNKFNLFLVHWIEFEKFFRNTECIFIFKKIVVFFIENKNYSLEIIEGNFNNFVHQLLNSVGQNMVSITLKESSMLFNSFGALNDTISNIIFLNLKPYKKQIKRSNTETIDMLEKFVDENENYIDVIFNLLNFF